MAAHRFVVERVPFAALDRWRFDMATGGLRHVSGKFFTVDGLHVEQEGPVSRTWDQPILHQAEIGILGFVVKKFDGLLHFLVQAKMEPGNLHYVQVSPTVQATRSNFTRVHQGRAPRYLEYFLGDSCGRVLVDTLQSEQGSRFFRKVNRNVVVEVTEDVTVSEDHCWLTLGQLQSLLRRDNVVNMDARTVLGCLPFVADELANEDPNAYPGRLEELCGVDRGLLRTPLDPFEVACLQSLVTPMESPSYATTLRWLSRHRFTVDQTVVPIAPRQMQDWQIEPDRIGHRDGKYFEVIGVRVEASNREVPAWCQPIIKPRSEGLMACFSRVRDGRVEVLLQANAEPGNADGVELGPTVQCFPADHTEGDLPVFAKEAQETAQVRWRVNTCQSEEGGRFYQEANRNRIIEMPESWAPELPESHRWVPLSQIRPMTLHPRLLNVEARCLLASLGTGALTRESARSA